MNYNEFIQETFNSFSEIENPFVDNDPLGSTDIANNSGSFSTPTLDTPIESTVIESQYLIEMGDLINLDIATSTTDSLTGTTIDSLTGTTNSQESLLYVVKDSPTEEL